MGDIEIKKIVGLNNKKENKQLFRLTSKNNEIYIKLDKIYLPFDYQKYGGNLYVNAEILKKDKNKLSIINLFEKQVSEQMKYDINDKKFISVIKNRKDRYHVKLMLKRYDKKILIDTNDDFNIHNLKEYHKLNYIYDIIIKPEIVWMNEDSYGIIYYLMKIIN